MQEWGDDCRINQISVKKKEVEDGVCVPLYRHTVLPGVLLLQELRLLRQPLRGKQKKNQKESEVRGEQDIDGWMGGRQRQMLAVTLLSLPPLPPSPHL